jgi:hypothetical protein
MPFRVAFVGAQSLDDQLPFVTGPVDPVFLFSPESYEFAITHIVQEPHFVTQDGVLPLIAQILITNLTRSSSFACPATRTGLFG